MKGSQHITNAKAVVALLVLAIAFVLFYKLFVNQSYFQNDPEALQHYVLFSFVGIGFLVGLLFLASNTKHKVTTKAKAVKASKPTKTKKKKK